MATEAGASEQLYQQVASFAIDATQLSVAEFRAKHGDGFLVHHGPIGSLREAQVPQRTLAVEGPALGQGGPQADFIVFAVKQSGRSPFPNFISVGRTRNNDVVVNDVSLSKFHAFFRHEGGRYLLQDAGSRNGTFVNGAPAPTKQNGEPIAVTSGDTVRFGGVDLTFLNVEQFLDMVKMLTR